MRFLLPALLLFLGNALSAQQTARVVTTINKGAPAWSTWKNEACALDHPGSWARDNSGITGPLVTFLAPRDSSGVSHARVELTVADLQGPFNDFLRDHGPDLHLHGALVTTDTPYDDQHLRELEGKLDGRAVRVSQNAWLKDGKVYTLSYIADAADYEEDRVQAEAMIKSFRFLP